ncbi:MAG TPA: DUF4349 domain-containing protein [Patescibacteria group bacterium]|nr:DUF4349 domain-containing protein [Patescibacteria group bacterium]
MKKLVVIIAILAAAAACGSSSAATAISAADHSTGLAQAGGTSTAQSKTGAPPVAQPNGSAALAPDALPAIQGPQVIRQAQLAISVSSSSFDSKLAAVRAIVEQEQGYIAGTDAQANPQVPADQIRSGVITFMVPAARFDETIDLVTKLGKVENEHISGTDVSAQYVDLQARLANEEAQRDAMLALLGKAQSISDIIAVQTQLGQITQQIEELKGQISYIDHNTTFSTVTVQISEAGAPAPTTSTDSWGLVSALSDAAHNFVTTVNYLITGIGAIGPVLVLAGIGFLYWRRRRAAPVANHA